MLVEGVDVGKTVKVRNNVTKQEYKSFTAQMDAV